MVHHDCPTGFHGTHGNYPRWHYRLLPMERQLQHIAKMLWVSITSTGNRRCEKWLTPWARHTKMDEGVAMFLHWLVIELLDLPAPTYRWQWNDKPTPGMPAAVHVSLVIGAGSYCLPSSTFKIKHWLLNSEVSEHQKWVEVYACMLQWLAEASVGWSWTMEGQTMTPEVTKLVETFIAVTGMWVSLHRIWGCWPTAPDEIPQKNLDKICTTIVKHLEEVASRQLSLTAWDMFTFSEEDKEHWWEDCLSYYPGMVVNIGIRMPGIQLTMQDAKGQYNSNAHILLMRGRCWHMIQHPTFWSGCLCGACHCHWCPWSLSPHMT